MWCLNLAASIEYGRCRRCDAWWRIEKREQSWQESRRQSPRWTLYWTIILVLCMIECWIIVLSNSCEAITTSLQLIVAINFMLSNEDPRISDTLHYVNHTSEEWNPKVKGFCQDQISVGQIAPLSKSQWYHWQDSL